MKGIILLLALTTSLSALASFNWSLTSHDTIMGKTEAEITAIVTKYPEILHNSEYTAADMDFIHVIESTFEFTGKHTCAEGDERLTHFDVSYMACPKNEPTRCITKFRELLSDEDPCKE